MLTIKCFEVNPIQENTYVVSDETKEAVIIDCGTFYSQEHQALITYLRNEGLKLRHLLCTHGYWLWPSPVDGHSHPRSYARLLCLLL